MSDYQIFITQENQNTTIKSMVAMIVRGLAGGMVVATLGREKRSLPQNKKMWPMLQDVSDHVVWYGNKLTREEWKDVLSAGLTKQRAVPGIDGGFVMLGISTSKQSKEWFSELIELIFYFGSSHDVAWSDASTAIYEEYKEAS